MESFDVEDAGLSGMVALMKMSESALRCRVLGVVWLASVSEDDDGVESSPEKDVSRGESICRFARGERGRPTGSACVKVDILDGFGMDGCRYVEVNQSFFQFDKCLVDVLFQ